MTQIPPHDLDSEAAVLAAIMTSDECIHELDALKPEHFYAESHRRIFAGARALQAEGKPTDIALLGSWLKDHGQLENVGGLSYMTELLNACPGIRKLRHYAEIVITHAQRRAVIHKLHEATARAYQPDQPIAGIVDSLAETCQELLTGRERSTTEDGLAALKSAVRAIRDAAEGKTTPLMPTGLTALDRMLGGLGRGELVVPAARPGMGKSALAMLLAEAAVSEGFGSAVFSLEMPKEQLALRTLSRASGVDLQTLRMARLSPADWSALTASVAKLESMKRIIFDDASGETVQDIRLKARKIQRRLQREGVELRVVVVDYLQLVRGSADSREQEVSKIARGLKRMALELNITVVAPAQLNRGAEMRGDRRPLLSDLRESGAIEQDSDVVLLLYRDDYYNSESASRGICEVNVAKQRNGPTGIIKVGFTGETASFHNLDSDRLT